MASTFTNNLQLEQQALNDNVDLWGDPTLNQNVIARIDAAAGNTTSISLASTDVTLTQAQWRNANIVLTGTLSASVNIIFPLNVNSLTVAVGGDRTIDNQCTGNFTVTVQTAASGSTGIVVPQGVKSVVTSDTANVQFSDNRLGDTNVNRIATVAGSPNSVTTTVAPNAFKPGSVILDRTNRIVYAGPTADGNTGWVPINGFYPNPQGYLTLTSGTAIIPGDVTAATAVYYTPYVGNMVPIYDGSWLQAYFFSEQTLTLSSSQAASQIYDVFAFLNSGAVTIGTGPAWATPTAGAGSRGTGAGTTQLSRINGLWTNTVSMTMRNGASTYSIAANQGTYLGSLFMDGTNGQISCYRSAGQSRKWGVWNSYNRVPVELLVNDSTASWSYSSPTLRPSNNNSANSLTTLCGLAEEIIDVIFNQNVSGSSSSSTVQNAQLSIGFNSTSAASGKNGSFSVQVTSGVGNTAGNGVAQYAAPPQLGINVFTSLEANPSGSGATFLGGGSNMSLTAAWRG